MSVCRNEHAHSLASKSNLQREETSSASIKLPENAARDTVTSLKKLEMCSLETESDTQLVYL